MPCEIIKTADGEIGFMCTRGRKTVEKCFICGKPSINLCDVCDKPICKIHSHRVAYDTDVCPEHDNPEDIERAIKRRMEL